jgi:hypothetical protein
MIETLKPADRITIGAEPNPRHPTAPASFRAVTLFRPYSEQVDLLETLESLGEVTTHLSIIGMTTIRNGR